MAKNIILEKRFFQQMVTLRDIRSLIVLVSSILHFDIVCSYGAKELLLNVLV